MSIVPLLSSVCQSKFIDNNKAFNSNVFNCNNLSCSSSAIFISYPLYSNSRCLSYKNFNDYDSLSEPVFVLKEQCEKEILYLEDKKYEVAEKLRKKHFIKALMAYAVYSATQYGISNKLQLKILEFKKLIIFTESFVSNSLVAEVNEINPKFVIFFYYLTKIISLNLVIDKGYLSKKNVLRNLFFLFVFGFERLKFFNFINKTTLFFNLSTSKRRKKRKSDKVSASRFVYYGVVPLLFYSPFKVSFFINNNLRFKNFLVKRSRFITNYSLVNFTAQKVALRNKSFLFNALLKLKLTFNLIKLRSNLNLMGISAIAPRKSIGLQTSSAFCNSSFIKKKRGWFFFSPKRPRFSSLSPTIKGSFKKQFEHYFFSLIRVFYLDRKFLLKRKKKKRNFKMKSRILFIIKALFKSGKFFFVGSYLKLLCYYYFIQKLEGIFFSGRIFRFKIFESLHKYNLLFKIFKKITKQKLIHLINNQNASNFKKSSSKPILLANSTQLTVIYTDLSKFGNKTNRSFLKFMPNIGLRFYKIRTFSKLRSTSFFFNIFLSIPSRALNLRSLRFCFLLFFLRTAMKVRVFFSLNSFLFSKYVRFLFFKLNLDNFNKQTIVGLTNTLSQFFLTNFFFLNNFFFSFRRKILFSFFEKVKKRSNKPFFGYFNLLFSLLTSKLISNSSQSLVVKKKKFYSRNFIKQFSALFYFFLNKSESLVNISSIKFGEKFVDGFASKYFYSFLLPKRPVKRYRLVFLARLEAAKKRVLNLLLRSKKQKRKVKVSFHSSIRIQRKNVYRSLKRKANFFFRLLKIFMPSLKLAGRFSVFSAYRKKSKKLPMLLDYYKKSFYIPKSFLRRCLDQHNNLFTRLNNIYLSKGGKLTILGPTLLVAENILNFLNTTTVSYVFFMKWRIFAAVNFFGLSVSAQVSEYSFKCLFTWLSMVKSKYLLPILSQISPLISVTFGSPFFDYFILVRFFMLLKLESFFSKLIFRFVNVLLEAFLVLKFLTYSKFLFLFLFYLPLYKSKSEFTSGILNPIFKTNSILKRSYSSSNFLFNGMLTNKRNRLPRKIGKKIYYFASGIFFRIKRQGFLKLQPSLSEINGDYFFSFSDYYIFYKLFSNLRFEFKVHSLNKSLKFFLTLNYLPSWFGYFFLRNGISLGTANSFFSRFNSNPINYSAPFSIGFFSFLVFFFKKYRFFIYRVQKRKSRSRGRRCNKWFTFLRIFYFKYFIKLGLKKLKGLRRQSRARVVLAFSANSFNKSFLFNIFFDFIQIRFKELVSICYSLFNSFSFSFSVFSSNHFREYFNFFILRQVFFIFFRAVTLKFRSLFPNKSGNYMVIQLYRGLFGKHVKFYFLLLVKAVSLKDFDYLNYLFRCRKVCEKFYSKFIFMAFRNMRYRLNSRNFIFSLFKSLKKLFPFSISSKGGGFGHRNFSLLFGKQSMSNNFFFPMSRFVSFKSLDSKIIFPIFSLSQNSRFGQLFLKFLSNIVYLKLLKFLCDAFNKYVYLGKLQHESGVRDAFLFSYFYLFSTDFYTLVIYFNMVKSKLCVLKKNMIGIILSRIGTLLLFFGFYNLRKIFSDVGINQSSSVLVKQLYIYLLLYFKKFIFWFSTLPIKSLLTFPKEFKRRTILPVYSFKYFLLKYFLLKGRFKSFLHFRRMFFRNNIFQKFYFEKFKLFRVIKLKVRRYTLNVVKKRARLFDSYLRKRKVILGRIILNRKHLIQKKSFFLDVFFSVKFLKFSGFKNFMACCSFFSSYIGLPYKLKRRFIKMYLFFFGFRMSFLKSFFLKFFLAGLYLRYRLQMLNRYLFFRIIFLKTFKLYPRFYFVISRSRNNIFLTIRSLQGRLIYKCTPGLLKFKGSDKLSNFALYETCLYFFDIFIKLCQEITLRRKFGYFFYNMRTRRKKSEERIRKKSLGDYSRVDNKDLFQDPLLRVQRFFLITKGISPYLVRIFLKAMRRRKVSKYMAGTLEYPFIAFTNSKVRKVRRI